MNYYFCKIIQYENTYIEEYDNFSELIKEKGEYMKKNDDWYIIKGEEV